MEKKNPAHQIPQFKDFFLGNWKQCSFIGLEFELQLIVWSSIPLAMKNGLQQLVLCAGGRSRGHCLQDCFSRVLGIY